MLRNTLELNDIHVELGSIRAIEHTVQVSALYGEIDVETHIPRLALGQRSRRAHVLCPGAFSVIIADVVAFARNTWGFLFEAAAWAAGMVFLSWSPTDILYGVLVSTFFQTLRFHIVEMVSFRKHQEERGDTRKILGASDVIPILLLYAFFTVCVLFVAALLKFPKAGAPGIWRPLAVIAAVSAARFAIDLVLRLPGVTAETWSSMDRFRGSWLPILHIFFAIGISVACNALAGLLLGAAAGSILWAVALIGLKFLYETLQRKTS